MILVKNKIKITPDSWYWTKGGSHTTPNCHQDLGRHQLRSKQQNGRSPSIRDRQKDTPMRPLLSRGFKYCLIMLQLLLPDCCREDCWCCVISLQNAPRGKKAETTAREMNQSHYELAWVPPTSLRLEIPVSWFKVFICSQDLSCLNASLGCSRFRRHLMRSSEDGAERHRVVQQQAGVCGSRRAGRCLSVLCLHWQYLPH